MCSICEETFYIRLAQNRGESRRALTRKCLSISDSLRTFPDSFGRIWNVLCNFSHFRTVCVRFLSYFGAICGVTDIFSLKTTLFPCQSVWSQCALARWTGWSPEAASCSWDRKNEFPRSAPLDLSVITPYDVQLQFRCRRQNGAQPSSGTLGISSQS